VASSRSFVALIVAVALVMAIVGATVPDWFLNQLLVALARGLAVLGLMVLLRTGLVSFGHALYLGLGAYIWLGGEEITGLRPRDIARRGVGRSFQVAQLFSGLTAFENLLMAAGVASQSVLTPLDDPGRIAACQQIFDELGLSPYRNQKIAAMPQGARKLLDIAMALAAAPKLLVLDEPTSGVSSQQKLEVMDRVIQAVAGNAMAVILIEHDMEIVERYVDRILAFAQGDVICEGRPDKVLNDPTVREKILGG
jgi:branched-chain amino acid transport system ATP-binding protein